MSPIAYLYVAIGGALGSLARAWISVQAATLLGPQFPWGTIVINILGSFVIALFGALTVADGRLPLSADLRAFAMVGVCGGFTTFSSFSLQTLDLARDGRMLQAFANVAISVVICIAAAALGFWAATTLNAGRGNAVSGQEGFGDRVLALVSRPDTAPAVLDAAERLIALHGRGHVQILTIGTPSAATLMVSEEVLTADRQADRRAERDGWAAGLATVLQHWEQRSAAGGLASDILHVVGDPTATVSEYGRRAGVVVASRMDHAGERARQGLHAALFETGRPVLIVPPGAARPFGRVVAIAWRPGGAIETLVVTAAPLLQRADRIYVLHVGEAGAGLPILPDALTGLGVESKLRLIPPHGATGARLLEAAREAGADLLVMGAFTHGEWREALLGGVTAFMLDQADLALLMQC